MLTFNPNLIDWTRETWCSCLMDSNRDSVSFCVFTLSLAPQGSPPVPSSSPFQTAVPDLLTTHCPGEEILLSITSSLSQFLPFSQELHSLINTTNVSLKFIGCHWVKYLPPNQSLRRREYDLIGVGQVICSTLEHLGEEWHERHCHQDHLSYTWTGINPESKCPAHECEWESHLRWASN